MYQDWDRTTDLRFLNRPCGLELSLCTGIARRLPLRELFYGDVLEYLRLRLPGEWTRIKSILTNIPGQSQKEFGEWLSKLTASQTEVMQKATVLLLLDGVYRSGEGWPYLDMLVARKIRSDGAWPPGQEGAVLWEGLMDPHVPRPRK